MLQVLTSNLNSDGQLVGYVFYLKGTGSTSISHSLNGCGRERLRFFYHYITGIKFIVCSKSEV